MIEENKLSKITVDYDVYETKLTRKYQQRKPYHLIDSNKIAAIIPGVINRINVVKGQSIKNGDSLLILEAMKMLNDIKSHRQGRVKAINVKQGDMVAKGEVLIEIED
jgi:biotin carboxyl carrier protein